MTALENVMLPMIFGGMSNAAAQEKAADILKSSCPPTDARTPPARLAAVGTRLDSLLQTLGTVRPALDTFYDSLTDEQKAAFDAIGPERNGATNALAADGNETPRPHHRGHRHGYNFDGMTSKSRIEGRSRRSRSL